MGSAPLVIALVGLVIPIAMLLLAIVVDIAVIMWALYRVSYDHARPVLVRFEHRVLTLAHVHQRI
jgi:hypothetical protein